MTLGKLLMGTILGGGVLMAGTASFTGAGVTADTKAQQFSLRQASTRSSYYNNRSNRSSTGSTRTHQGGGLRGGK